MTDPKSCLILGAGGHARVVLSILQETSNRERFNVIGILDSSPASINEEILGCKVIGAFDDLERTINVDATSIFLAIGDNRKRAEYFHKSIALGYRLPNLISSAAYVAPTAKMGEGNIICPNATVGPEVKLGNNNLLNSASVIEHESVLTDHCHLAPGAVVCGRTTFGSSILLGASATVLNYRTIASDVVIGAGAVVINDIPETHGVYVGNPARRVK